MTAIDDRLAALRPAPQWTPDEQDALLQRVLHSAPDRRLGEAHLAQVRPRRRQRRAITVTALTGLAAAAAVAAPTFLPAGSPEGSQSAAAAGLYRLAKVATPTDADTIGPHAYWHVVFDEWQTASSAAPSSQTGVSRTRNESWTSSDGGRGWFHHVTRSRSETYVLGLHKPDHQILSARYLRTLPTDPNALFHYLSGTTNGSPTVDEAVFNAVPGLIGTGIAPLGLRRAALEMLARMGQITLGSVTRDEGGNAVQEFVFHRVGDPADQAESLMFDTRTALLTERRQYYRGKVDYQGWVVRAGAVASVPASIRSAATPTH